MEISLASPTGTSGDLSRILDNYQESIGTSPNKTKATSGEQSHEDTVTLSREGRELARSQPSSEETAKVSPATSDKNKLNAQELLELQELKRRDTEVRTHEQAHLTAAGPYARGGPSFTYQKGPDGVSYAIGGEVGIDLSKERTPEATITKMETIKRAALAPASPSPADRSIAAEAGMIESQARQESLAKTQEALLHANPANISVSGKQQTVTTQYSSTYKKVSTMIAAYQRFASH